MLWEEGQKQTQGDQLEGCKCARASEEAGGLDHFAKVERLKRHPSYVIYT